MMKTFHKFIFTLGIFTCAALSMSSGQKEPVIKNPKKPVYDRNVFSINEELSIGVAEGKEEYMFSRLWYLAVDEQENIYAMDQGETHVKVYDKNGNFLKAIGKKGEGPGELQNPDNIFILKKNQLVIEDYIRNITFYTLSGEYIKTLSTTRVFPIGVLLNSRGDILTITNISEPDNWGKEVSLYDKDLHFQKIIISIPSPKPDPQILKPFQPEINWTIYAGDSFIISYKEDYEFQIFNSQGDLVKTIIKEYEPVRITEEDLKQRVKRVPEGRKLVLPKFFPAIHSLTSDDQGRISVHTYEKVGDGKYYNDVFDREGRYITRVLLKDRLQIWKKGKLYTIEENDAGFQVIKRYKVVWNY